MIENTDAIAIDKWFKVCIANSWTSASEAMSGFIKWSLDVAFMWDKTINGIKANNRPELNAKNKKLFLLFLRELDRIKGIQKIVVAMDAKINTGKKIAPNKRMAEQKACIINNLDWNSLFNSYFLPLNIYLPLLLQPFLQPVDIILAFLKIGIVEQGLVQWNCGLNAVNHHFAQGAAEAENGTFSCVTPDDEFTD